MAQTSSIEWTEASWNPVTGCSKISPGCQNCYAARMARRLQAMGITAYANGFQVTCHPYLLHLPLSWRKPRRIFVCSMSDLFHPLVADEFILAVLQTIDQAKHHTFQILTKRSERLAALANKYGLPPNVWAGVTIESADYLFRIEHLQSVPAAVRFLSLEPLLGPLPEIKLDGIDWVIVGGESGPGARPMAYAWVEAIKEVCRNQGVAFFFKQWGGKNRKKTGRLLDGKLYQNFPAIKPLPITF